MHDRDSDISKFSYHSYRTLKSQLGEFDAVVECNEIAIREFLSHAEADNAADYIQLLSSKHQIRVDTVNFLAFSARIRQYYISSVFQQAEQFLKDFKAEWRRYHKDSVWTEKSDGETVLQNTLKATGLYLPSEVLDMYDYYRLIRNYMSHNDRDLKEIGRKYNVVMSNDNTFLSGFQLLCVPNELDKINFDDFLILSNIIKHIAFLLSTHSKPSNSNIAEILRGRLEEDKGKLHGIKKLKNKPERFEAAIKSFASSTFGRFSDADSKEIYVNLSGLLA